VLGPIDGEQDGQVLEETKVRFIVCQEYQYRNQKEEKRDFHAYIPK
jgi:hypothetical protein